LITVVAAFLVAFSHPFAAGWVILFAGLFDMLDGALARRTNNVTKFGGVLDSHPGPGFRGSSAHRYCRAVC